MRPKILFITNPHNSDPEEDQFLAAYLSEIFEVQICTLTEAINLIGKTPRCLIRNAWPSRLFKPELTQFQGVCKAQNILVYNPIHRQGYLEDKNYLVSLYQAGYPVIPSTRSVTNLDDIPQCNEYLIKPLDGASSWGIETLSKTQLVAKNPQEHLIQPKLQFQDEISFFFIDNQPAYNLVSAGPKDRWNLKEYAPTKVELEFAKTFVAWNQLPYGLQRIDACRMPNGHLYLMEIEDTMPYLSLEVLTDETKAKVLKSFFESLQKQFSLY